MFGNQKGAITPAQLATIADISTNSLSTARERRERSRAPFIGLVRGMLKRGEVVSPTLVDEMYRFQAEIKAEQDGGGIER